MNAGAPLRGLYAITSQAVCDDPIRLDAAVRAAISGGAVLLQYRDKLASPAQKRANAVKDYLAKQGYVNTQVAEVHAVGEDQQVKACESVTPRSKLIECLAPNRRVHLDVTYAQDRNVYHERPVSYNQRYNPNQR